MAGRCWVYAGHAWPLCVFRAHRKSGSTFGGGRNDVSKHLASESLAMPELRGHIEHADTAPHLTTARKLACPERRSRILGSDLHHLHHGIGSLTERAWLGAPRLELPVVYRLKWLWGLQRGRTSPRGGLGGPATKNAWNAPLCVSGDAARRYH